MSDTEALDLIQHYGWNLLRTSDGWSITCDRFINAPRPTVREAIQAAMTAQFAWATRQ